MAPSYELRAISSMHCKITNRDEEFIIQNESYHYEARHSRAVEK